jgi:hypothetical protein
VAKLKVKCKMKKMSCCTVAANNTRFYRGYELRSEEIKAAAENNSRFLLALAPP